MYLYCCSSSGAKPPFCCMILTCLKMVLFPDSPGPVQRWSKQIRPKTKTKHHQTKRKKEKRKATRMKKETNTKTQKTQKQNTKTKKKTSKTITKQKQLDLFLELLLVPAQFLFYFCASFGFRCGHTHPASHLPILYLRNSMFAKMREHGAFTCRRGRPKKTIKLLPFYSKF